MSDQPAAPKYTLADVKEAKLANGNAALICSVCRGVTDKGCPPIGGQHDDGFKCYDCTEKENDVERARRIEAEKLMLAAKAPTMVITGDAASHGATLEVIAPADVAPVPAAILAPKP